MSLRSTVAVLAITTAGLTGSLAAAVPASAGGRPLTTTLTGAEEVPGPGDPDGAGLARLTANPGTGQICYSLTVTGIDPALAAHIHLGDAGVAGLVVQALEAPTDGSSSACVTNLDVARGLVRDASAYYVNVHNAAYPAGAIRGQLGD